MRPLGRTKRKLKIKEKVSTTGPIQRCYSLCLFLLVLVLVPTYGWIYKPKTEPITTWSAKPLVWFSCKKIRLWDKTKHPNHCSALLDHSFSFQDENPLQQEWTVEPSFAWTFIWDSLPMPCLFLVWPLVSSCLSRFQTTCLYMWEILTIGPTTGLKLL